MRSLGPPVPRAARTNPKEQSKNSFGPPVTSTTSRSWSVACSMLGPHSSIQKRNGGRELSFRKVLPMCWVPTLPTALATPCHTPHRVVSYSCCPLSRHNDSFPSVCHRPTAWKTFETPTPRSSAWACPASSPLSWDDSVVGEIGEKFLLLVCWVPAHPTALATPCHTPHRVVSYSCCPLSR